MRLFIAADEWEPMQVLQEHLTSLGSEVSLVQHDAAPASLSEYAAGFCYLHGHMDAAMEQALVAYVHRGGRLIALHHALASARVRNPAWLELAGLRLAPRDAPRHAWRVVPHVTHRLVNLRPGHYLTSHQVPYDGTVDYVSSDSPSWPAPCPALDLPDTEVFLNQHFVAGAPRTVLFGSMCDDPESGQTVMQDRGGWIRRAGEGELIYLQPGHSPDDFRHPGYRQVIANCLSWDGRD